MRSNQFGSIPLSGLSQSFIGRAYKNYQNDSSNSSPHKKRRFDWGFGVEGRTNIGQRSNMQLIEAYGKLKSGIFQLKTGRSKDVTGLNGDTTLSTGNFAVSGNALGIPKIEISIPEYYKLPVFDGLFSIKGNFAHGWVGKTRILDSIPASNKTVYYINNKNPLTYIHQKSLYLKVGLPKSKFKAIGGFNHQVFWGNEQSAYGSNFKLSTFSTFLHVISGKAYGTTGVPKSKIGNQLGSFDIGGEYAFKDFTINLYRQFFFDVGALFRLANIRDGLTGVTIKNNNFNNSDKNFKWKKITVEAFYSKNQAGYPWSKVTKSGDENYYNNYYYLEGWSYKNLGIGSPLITPIHNARDGQKIAIYDYFLNNRLLALHLGYEGQVGSLNIISKLTYSKNFGTFGTSVHGRTTGNIRNPQATNIFMPVNQLSFYLEGNKVLKNNYTIGFATSIDQGKLLDNSLGIMLKINKNF